MRKIVATLVPLLALMALPSCSSNTPAREIPGHAAAQLVTCQLMADDSSSFVGECGFGTATRNIELSRPVTATDAL